MLLPVIDDVTFFMAFFLAIRGFGWIEASRRSFGRRWLLGRHSRRRNRRRRLDSRCWHRSGRARRADAVLNRAIPV